ncbi:MAG: hypothetical protein ACKVPY_06510, partial [Paracoccaceae bacterium]
SSSSHREDRERRAASASARLLAGLPKPTRSHRKWQVLQTFLKALREVCDVILSVCHWVLAGAFFRKSAGERSLSVVDLTGLGVSRCGQDQSKANDCGPKHFLLSAIGYLECDASIILSAEGAGK